MDKDQVICQNCGRPFEIWDIHEKNIKCPYCDAKGTNPYYVKPQKIAPEKMFTKLKQN